MSSSNTVDPADRVETRSRRARRTSSSPLSFLNEFCTTAAESFQMPPLVALILTHILQTEVKSKMNALKKRLQREPAFPDGSPARRTIMGACQIAAQACDLRPKRTHRHGSRRMTRALGQHGQHQRINHRIRRTLWVFTSGRTYLQQAHGKRRQQTQQTDQAVNRSQLPFFNATAAFEAL